MICGVGHRCSSVLALLWLGKRGLVEAQMDPTARELLYAVGATKKKKKKKKKKVMAQFYQ